MPISWWCPLPFKGNHEPDVSYVEAATRSVIPFLKEGDLYVIESTSPVGTTDKMADIIFADARNWRVKSILPTVPNACCPAT